MNESLFPDDRGAGPDHGALIAQYQRTGRTLDDLPYTSELHELCARLGRDGEEREILDSLLRLRKAGRLPRTDAKPAGRVKLDPEHDGALRRMVIEEVGSMGKRDRLPHTARFDDLLARFNADRGLSLDAHDLWRVVARLAK